MRKPKANRRASPRLKIHRSLRVPVHLSAVVPFIGKEVDAGLLDLSERGTALHLPQKDLPKQIRRGTTIKFHMRLPGHPLQECGGIVRHVFRLNNESVVVGIRFTRIPQRLKKELAQMIHDNDRCDKRLQEQSMPWCDPDCSFHNLCKKPIRFATEDRPSDQLEITIQTVSF